MGQIIIELLPTGPDFPSLYQNIIRGIYKPVPNHFSNNLCELVKVMLRPNPSRRPSAEQVMQLLNEPTFLKLQLTTCFNCLFFILFFFRFWAPKSLLKMSPPICRLSNPCLTHSTTFTVNERGPAAPLALRTETGVAAQRIPPPLAHPGSLIPWFNPVISDILFFLNY